MNLGADVSSVMNEAAMYSNLALIFLVIAVTCGISAIVMWFVFDIPHSIVVLTGMRTKSSMKKLASGQRTTSSEKAVISWNTSGALTAAAATDPILEPVEATVLLDQETELLDSSVDLNTYRPNGFEMEEDIIITGSDKSIN